jgi:hypothetical protein
LTPVLWKWASSRWWSLGLRLSARTMLVMPSVSTRTVMPATMVANHMKVLRRENAGRNSWIAFHHKPHSDSGRPRSNMDRSMVALIRGPC